MRNEIRLYVVVPDSLVAWIYHTGFIFLSPVLSEGFEMVALWQKCVNRTRYYQGNDVVELVAPADHNELNFDLSNIEFSKNVTVPKSYSVRTHWRSKYINRDTRCSL